MPRQRTYEPSELTDRAMRQFWRDGYHASSVERLVAATGVSRHGLYAEAGGKNSLYLMAFDHYEATIVSPAFADVEAGGGVKAISDYFDVQIRLAEKLGLPGPGCLVANAATETAPHDPAVAEKVERHRARLRAGFKRALQRDAPQLTRRDADDLALFLTVSAQGLWSFSRTQKNPAPLRRYARQLVQVVREQIKND